MTGSKAAATTNTNTAAAVKTKKKTTTTKKSTTTATTAAAKKPSSATTTTTTKKTLPLSSSSASLPPKASSTTTKKGVTKTKITPILCWVKQGRTDHMATLIDPDVLSLLERNTNNEKGGNKTTSTDTTTTTTALSDLMASDTEINIKWQSTNKSQWVLVESVTLILVENSVNSTGGERRRSSLRR